MIPNNIGKHHILKAIEKVDKEGFPPNRDSTKFDLFHNNILYPPKYLISIANKFANGMELTEFSGGDETNDFLTNLGFSIVKKSGSNDESPLNSNYNGFSFQSHSWTIVSKTIATKELDKSTFLHHGTGIPVDVRDYFEIKDMSKGQRKEISLHYDNRTYTANIEMDKQPNPRTRLFWKSDFSNTLRETFPTYHATYSTGGENTLEPLKMKFERLNEKTYSASFITPISLETLEQDIAADVAENQEPRTEGAIKHFYGKRYERDATNRKRAIEIHGLSCVVCGFNFEKVYGARGKEFVEVHHNKPLSTFDGNEVEINPETDLVPVCSNCHRMIHRKHDDVLDIAQLKEMINDAISS